MCTLEVVKGDKCYTGRLEAAGSAFANSLIGNLVLLSEVIEEMIANHSAVIGRGSLRPSGYLTMSTVLHPTLARISSYLCHANNTTKDDHCSDMKRDRGNKECDIRVPNELVVHHDDIMGSDDRCQNKFLSNFVPYEKDMHLPSTRARSL